MELHFRKIFPKIGFFLSSALLCLALLSCQGMSPIGPTGPVGTEGGSSGGLGDVGDANSQSVPMPGGGFNAAPVGGPEPEFSPGGPADYFLAVCQTMVSINGCNLDEGSCPDVGSSPMVTVEYKLHGRVFEWQVDFEKEIYLGYQGCCTGKVLKILYAPPSSTFVESKAQKVACVPLEDENGEEGFFNVTLNAALNPQFRFFLGSECPDNKYDREIFLAKSSEKVLEESGDSSSNLSLKAESQTLKKLDSGWYEFALEGKKNLCLQTESGFFCPYWDSRFRMCTDRRIELMKYVPYGIE